VPLNLLLVNLLDPLFLFSARTFALPIDSINHILNARLRHVADLMLDIDIDRMLGLNLRQLCKIWVAFELLHYVIAAIIVIDPHRHDL